MAKARYTPALQTMEQMAVRLHAPVSFVNYTIRRGKQTWSKQTLDAYSDDCFRWLWGRRYELLKSYPTIRQSGDKLGCDDRTLLSLLTATPSLGLVHDKPAQRVGSLKFARCIAPSTFKNAQIALGAFAPPELWPIGDFARILGCQPRTAERKLKRTGVPAQSWRSAMSGYIVDHYPHEEALAAIRRVCKPVGTWLTRKRMATQLGRSQAWVWARVPDEEGEPRIGPNNVLTMCFPPSTLSRLRSENTQLEEATAEDISLIQLARAFHRSHKTISRDLKTLGLYDCMQDKIHPVGKRVVSYRPISVRQALEQHYGLTT